MESIPGIIVSGEIPRRCWTANRSIEHPAPDRAIHDGALNTKNNHATGELAHHDENAFATLRIHGGTNRNSTSCPSCGEEREPGWASRVRFRPVLNAQDMANNILVDSTPQANVVRWAIRGQPQLGLRRFISVTASMSSHSVLFGAGGWLRLDENNKRYFR